MHHDCADAVIISLAQPSTTPGLKVQVPQRNLESFVLHFSTFQFVPEIKINDGIIKNSFSVLRIMVLKVESNTSPMLSEATLKEEHLIIP